MTQNTREQREADRSNEEGLCRGCWKPLLKENAWMADGCPCNTAMGVNHGNQQISDWRNELRQDAERQREDFRRLASRQSDEIQNLHDMADAVECLREIGRQTGCDHVDGPDGRRQLVNCVEQTIEKLETEKLRLRELADSANESLAEERRLGTENEKSLTQQIQIGNAKLQAAEQALQAARSSPRGETIPEYQQAVNGLVSAASSALAHLQELRDAWMRGAIRETDNLGGTRSNTNVDVEVALRKSLEPFRPGEPT